VGKITEVLRNSPRSPLTTQQPAPDRLGHNLLVGVYLKDFAGPITPFVECLLGNTQDARDVMLWTVTCHQVQHVARFNIKPLERVILSRLHPFLVRL